MGVGATREGPLLRREREHTGRASASVALACLLALACACSSGAGGGASPNGVDSAAKAAETADDSASDQGSNPVSFELVNYTGTSLRTVNFSPSDTAGWEENIIDGSELADGESVEIRFSPEQKVGVWDMRVVGVDNRSAVWKGLRLGNVSRVTLSVDMAGGPVVVAEVE
jgi:hypothetical protein